ncbi:MAG: type II toxin-antitoxin system VapC family toxin [Rhodoglobus sp.]
MRELVLDSSAAVNGSPLIDSAGVLSAPEIIDLEVANVLRKAVLRGLRGTDEASEQFAGWASNVGQRFPHTPLLATVWAMRHNITPYDASYVALAVELDVPLLTADRKLAAAAASYCEVILIE